MKHTSWLSGLAAVRRPSAAASPRTSAFVRSPTGKQHARQLALVEHVQDVPLILRRDRLLLDQPHRPVRRPHAPARDGPSRRIEPELIGPVGAAGRTSRAGCTRHRVRRRPAACSATYGLDDIADEVVTEVEDGVIDAELLGDAAASSTSLTEQQPRSVAAHSFIVTPTTSCPASRSSAAATDESTPPDMATITCTALPAELRDRDRDDLERPIHIGRRRCGAERALSAVRLSLGPASTSADVDRGARGHPRRGHEAPQVVPCR